MQSIEESLWLETPFLSGMYLPKQEEITVYLGTSTLLLLAHSWLLSAAFHSVDILLSLLQVSSFSLLFQNPVSLLFPRKLTMPILLDYLVYRNITADNSPQMLSGT